MSKLEEPQPILVVDRFPTLLDALLELLGGLTPEEWATPRACGEWSVKDVVSHLAGTDRFWAIGFSAAMKGEPTRFLTTFDPVTTPEQHYGAIGDDVKSAIGIEVRSRHGAHEAAEGGFGGSLERAVTTALQNAQMESANNQIDAIIAIEIPHRDQAE